MTLKVWFIIYISNIETKTIIFDMDETLIHCVDDNEAEHPDVIIPIDFPEEDELVDVIHNIFNKL